jgi:hypothetical protein
MMLQTVIAAKKNIIAISLFKKKNKNMQFQQIKEKVMKK